MKKSLLFAGFAALALMAGAQNPFAYNISSEAVAADATEMTLHYTLNADAVNVGVTFYADGEAVSTVAINGENTKGEHSATVSLEGLPTGKEITWAVFAEGQALEAPTALTDIKNPAGSSLAVWGPYALAIDNNPESKHFGRILYTESHAGVLGNNNYTSVKDGVGLGVYELDPQLNLVKNAAGTYGYNGGINWVNKNYTSYEGLDAASSAIYGPKRVKISKDGRIFVSVADLDNCPIYEMNPDNLNEWTPVFNGSYQNFENGTRWFATEQGVQLASAAHAFDVTGEGENLKLLVLSHDIGYSFATPHNHFTEFALGTANSISEPGTTVQGLEGQYVMNPIMTNLAYGKDGDIWLFQDRGQDDVPVLAHVNDAADTQPYEKYFTDFGYRTNGAAVAFNADFSMIAFGLANHIYLYKVTDANAEGAPRKAPATMETGNVVLSDIIDITGYRNNNAIAFDLAGNLYTCANTNERIGFIALPREEPVCEVPARAEFAFTLGEAAPEPISNLAVVGSFQGWDVNNGVEMTKNDNDIFEAEVEFPAGTLFKLIENLDTHINWYGGAAESDEFWVSPEMIENATEIDLVDGSNFKIDDAGTYIISVNANTRKMTVTAKPVEAKYFVAGGFNGWSTSENELEAQDDVYTATIDVVGEDEESRMFKIVRVDNATTWFGGADDNNLGKFIVTEELLGKDITLLEGEGENLLLPAAGNYTFNLTVADAAAPAGMAKAEGQAFKLVVVKNDVTGVETINAEDIAAVKYVNMAGQVSATPFEGVNVKVI
ncbi:MAG: SusF/SusE family outer membrane protein, partial [Muribaculaceae bacterium]|nr:SusF/SusE family outer membrane protein [Muribaculaceae bacterium]